jgi:integrase
MHHHRVLREALHQAIKWQTLGRNVADAVEPPRPERKEMCALDEAETARLLEAVQGSRMYTPILVAVTTGLRRGELLGLRWQDVELDTEILAVRQSIEPTFRIPTP